MSTLRLISSDRKRVARLLELLDTAGYKILAGSMTEDLRQQLLDQPPQAIIFDAKRAPATARDTGIFLRLQKSTRGIILVYLGGTAERVREIKQHLPDAVFTTEANLVKDLEWGLANPPADPIIPESVFAGYSGRPLPAKLGIKPGMQVQLIDAPPGLTDLLTPLPAAVEIGSKGRSPDITLWFVTSRSGLSSHLPSVLKRCRDGKLWIVWPKKSSGFSTDLTQAVVREMGFDAGWVDFKICAVDATWSALCFTKRKES